MEPPHLQLVKSTAFGTSPPPRDRALEKFDLLVLEGFLVSRPRSQRILGPEQEALSPVLDLGNLQPCLPAASATEVSPFRILRTRAARRFAVQRCRASGTPSDSPFTRSIWKTRKHPPRTGHPEASLLRNYWILLKNSPDQMAADSPRKKGGPRTSISWIERISANSLTRCFCPNRSQIGYVANRALHHLKARRSTMNFSASDFFRTMLVACFFVIADRGSSYAQPRKLDNYSGSTYSVRKGSATPRSMDITSGQVRHGPPEFSLTAACMESTDITIHGAIMLTLAPT